MPRIYLDTGLNEQSHSLLVNFILLHAVIESKINRWIVALFGNWSKLYFPLLFSQWISFIQMLFQKQLTEKIVGNLLNANPSKIGSFYTDSNARTIHQTRGVYNLCQLFHLPCVHQVKRYIFPSKNQFPRYSCQKV